MYVPHLLCLTAERLCLAFQTVEECTCIKCNGKVLEKLKISTGRFSGGLQMKVISKNT